MFRWLDGWSMVDSLHFSVATLATVGYGRGVPGVGAHRAGHRCDPRCLSGQGCCAWNTGAVGDLDGLGAEQRLASYGTLAPGRPNHHHVRGIPGRWFTGTVHGRLIEEGWGATMGFPALVLDPTGPEVEVQVLESAELPEHWERLDEFEGSGYQRVTALVMTADGPVHASIYVLAGEARRLGR